MEFNDKVLKLLNFRENLFSRLKSKSINYYEVVAFSYQFIGQNKIRHIAKSHDFSSLYQNYLYWTILIERKIALERQLIKLNVGSLDILEQHLQVYIQRRDQMVKRLILDCNIEIIDKILVFDNIVELECKNGIFLYCSKEVLDKLKVSNIKIRNSKQPFYIPFINIFA